MSDENGRPPDGEPYTVTIEPGFTGQVVLHCREGEVKKLEVSARGRVVEGRAELTGGAHLDSSSAN